VPVYPVTVRWERGRIRDVSKFSIEVAENEAGSQDAALADAEVTKATATVHFRDSRGHDHQRTYEFIGSVDDVSYKQTKATKADSDQDPEEVGVSKGWGPRPLLPDTSHASAELKPDPYVEKKAGVADEGDKSKSEVKKEEKAAEKAAVTSDSSAKSQSSRGSDAKKS
jgi:hypothetical protein